MALEPYAYAAVDQNNYSLTAASIKSKQLLAWASTVDFVSKRHGAAHTEAFLGRLKNAGLENARPTSLREVNWKKTLNVCCESLFYILMLQCMDYFVPALVTSAFKWYIIYSSLSCIV